MRGSFSGSSGRRMPLIIEIWYAPNIQLNIINKQLSEAGMGGLPPSTGPAPAPTGNGER